jgi:mRNA interferase RelE/StbE
VTGRYRIELRPAARKALKDLDRPAHRRIQAAIELLADNPRPPGASALQGRPGLRVRVGDYRIIYQVRDEVLVVAVIALGHRRATYRTR